jgi:hypothetical protein
LAEEPTTEDMAQLLQDDKDGTCVASSVSPLFKKMTTATVKDVCSDSHLPLTFITIIAKKRGRRHTKHSKRHRRGCPVKKRGAPQSVQTSDSSDLNKESAMNFRNTILSILIFCLSFQMVYSQDLTQTDSVSVQKEKQSIYRRHSIGSSLFLLGNLAPGDPPNYFQLNYGYHLTRKEVVLAEAITWTYYEPLGTYGSSSKSYPGKIKAYGLGVGYQRFYWKNLFSTVQATPFLQQFYDSENEIIQTGFQLFLQLRLGYRFEVFKHRWFIEPSAAFNYWPVNTNFPASFKDIESGSPNYFLFEPGLHFGYKF